MKLKGLIDFTEAEDSSDDPQPTPVAASGPVRRPAIAAASLFGLIALGVIVITVRTRNGETKIAVPDDQDVKIAVEQQSTKTNPAGHADRPGGGTTKRTDSGPSETRRSTSSEPLSQVNPELVAFYDFDDGTAKDKSGHGHHGVLSQSPPTFVSDGLQGGALSFEEKKKNVMTIPLDINATVLPQITMGGWFNANSSKPVQTLISHDNDGFDRSLKIHNRGGSGSQWSAFKRNGVLAGAPVKIGTWTFVAMRHDQLSGKLALDVDANRVTTKAFFGPGHNWTTVGASELKATRYATWFSGKIDNVFIYNEVLSDAKIADIRARGRDAILSVSEPAVATKSQERKPSETSGSDHPASITNSLGMKLTLIRTGEFMMGSSKEEDMDASDNETPRHRVRITRPFYLGVTEVTQGQYRAVTGQNPSAFNASDDLPVEQVTWNDAIAFCNALSGAEGLPRFYEVAGSNVVVSDWKRPGYRLPTEAEWEYACRANNPARYSFGDDSEHLGDYAWFDGNSGGMTHPVGQKRPNGFGLHDMHGNVGEWCWDGYDEEGLHSPTPADDPTGVFGAPGRVIRGGSWFFYPRIARSAKRSRIILGRLGRDLGFRVAQTVKMP